MKTLKVSFDFDSTLNTLPMQTLCKKFIDLGAEVHITTSRSNKIDGKVLNNDDVFEVAEQLGIPKKNIVFTKYEDKVHFIKDFDMHFDDSFDEIFLINQHPCKCMGFLYEQYQPSANGIADF